MVVGFSAELRRELIEGAAVRRRRRGRVENLSHQRLSWLDRSQRRGDCVVAVVAVKVSGEV